MSVEAEPGESPVRLPRRRRLRLDLTTPGLLGLPLGWLAVFFVVPIAIVAAYSVDALSLFPGAHPLTLQAWHDFLHSSVYLRLFWKSVQMSLIVSAIIVILAYPLAYYLALSGTKRKYVLLLVLIAPFLTSYLLRVLAWKVILGDEGVINTFLFWTGLRSPDHPHLAAALQPVRRHARARLHLAPVRGAAHLRRAREPRPAPARSGQRPRGKPSAGVQAGDAAAIPARCGGRVSLRLHPDAR